ncbi:hypothetical protein [Arthrobacter bambusae]|uniref:hypothetical protein n=1 Tax=Arthrobacter bambusae TaxID=1338426 RepID=UPI0027823480|nr:hypothetical protein [Arthrobacter bambusae]MDQ0213273.1 hypothetical protein [Arthrobacter bambusae]MDQ0235883.1 hypothetical protein [Arthrobacter bambusae]
MARPEHWHGGTRDNMMCHVALVEHDNGMSATWLEPVSDKDYQAAHAHLNQQSASTRVA